MLAIVLTCFLYRYFNILVTDPFYANFTNLGASGRFGPTSLGSHYVGKDHDNMVTVRNGTQFWTVPCTGKYEIKTVGAAGGYDIYGSAARGRGAYMRGEFELNKGDVLKILVGQEGGINSRSQSSGGGGGTFVARLLLLAVEVELKISKRG
jgi:tripartite motif-containing protein 56